MKLLMAAFVCVFCVCCKPKEQASKDSRAAWNKETSLQAYDKIGSKNPKWDSEAMRSLAEYEKLRAGITNYDQRTMTFNLTGTFATKAIDNGCDDPLIEYLYCRFAQGIPKEDLVTRISNCADKLQSSGYGPARKFFANLRAAQWLWEDRDRSVWDRVAQYQMAAINNFIEMAQDKSTPIQEINETGMELVETVSNEDWALKMIIDGAEPLLIKNWRKEDSVYAIRASLYYHYAWVARGGGYADKVTEAGWKGFGERLGIASEAAEKAWALNPKNTAIPNLMIKLAEAMQKPRTEMEDWFAKAMALEPNNYEACQSKLHYLYPQWYGSNEKMVAFGRECVESQVWTGRVPLTLLDAHDQIAIYIQDKELRKMYWSQPEVWKDIEASFDRFFELNPDAVGWHHNYAKYAYLCGQWDTLNKEIKLLGDVNYSYFGGRDKFDKMVELAKNHATDTTEK